MAKRKAYVAAHGRLYFVLVKSVGLNGFPAILLVLAFRDVVSDCICSLPECWSIRQSNRVDWLVSFSKMTNINPYRQCPLGIVFSSAPKCYAVQPIRWQHVPAAQATSPSSAFECASKLVYSTSVHAQLHCNTAALQPLPSPGKTLHYARETATPMGRDSHSFVFSCLLCLCYLQTV